MRVPVYDENTDQPRPLPAPWTEAGPQVRQALSAGAIAEGVGAAGLVLTKLAIDSKNRQSNAAVANLDNEAARWTQEALYGEKGALHKKGEQAFPITGELEKQYDEWAASWLPDFKDPDAQARAKVVLANRRVALVHQAEAHVYAESEKIAEATVVDGQVLALQAATQLAGNDKLTDAALRAQTDKVRDLNAGMPKDVVDAEVLKASGPFHLTVVKTLADAGNVGRASAYLARPEVESSMDASSANLARDVVKKADVGVEGELAKRTIIAKHTDDYGRVDRQAVEKALLDLSPGPVGDETRTRAEHALGVAEAGLAGRVHLLYGQAWEILKKTGSYGAIPASLLTSIDKLEPGLSGKLEDEAQKMELRRRGELGRSPQELQTWAMLQRMSEVEPEKFKNVRLYEDYGNQLTDQDFKHLTMVQSAKLGGDLAQSEEVALERIGKYVNYYADRAGIVPRDLPGMPKAKWTADQATKLRQLFDFVKAESDDILNSKNPHRPTQREIEEATVRGLKQVLVQTGGTRTKPEFENRALFEVPRGEHYHEVIPPVERRLILQQLQKDGLPQTEDAIQALWSLSRAKLGQPLEAPPPEPPELPPEPPKQPERMGAGRR